MADQYDPAVLRRIYQAVGPGRVERKISQGFSPEAAKQTSGQAVLDQARRAVMNGTRGTIAASAFADKARGVGWRRVTSSRPCAFCAMLATRGAVYQSQRHALATWRDLGDHSAGMMRYHPHCGCAAEPCPRGWEFADDALERQWAEVYDQAVRTTHGARDSRERTRQIIAKMRAIGDFSDSPHNRSSSVLRANRQQVIQLHNQVNSFLPEASRVGFAEHASLDFAYAERMISRLKDLTVHYQMVDRITMVEFADVRVGRKADAGAWVTPLGGGRSKVTVNMSEELRNLQLSVFTDGWFHAPQGTDLAEYFMTHEFGHVLDNATGFTAKNDATVKAIVRRLTSPPPGLLKTEDVVELAYAKGLISGYALFGYQEYKVFTELLAESFAAVLYNGAAASPVERTIYDRLMSALYR